MKEKDMKHALKNRLYVFVILCLIMPMSSSSSGIGDPRKYEARSKGALYVETIRQESGGKWGGATAVKLHCASRALLQFPYVRCIRIFNCRMEILVLQLEQYH